MSEAQIIGLAVWALIMCLYMWQQSRPREPIDLPLSPNAALRVEVEAMQLRKLRSERRAQRFPGARVE